MRINNDIQIPKHIKDLLHKINSIDNAEAYIVGGAVRDNLLNRAPKDYDIVTNLTPEQIKEIFPNAFTGGNSFLVSFVPSDGGLVEVATYRIDKSDCAEVAKNVKEDLLRRDFTINAILLSDKLYNLVEYVDYVNGIEDINNRVLRFVGTPERRILEDPVRILRGIRFASMYNLTIEKETYFEMCRLKELLNSIPKERIQLEIMKAFKSNNTHRFLTLLEEMEMLEFIFPNIAKLKNIDGGDYHRETVLHHCFNAVKAIEEKHWELKLAAMYHDVGKQYPIINEKGFNTFKNHNEKGIPLIEHDLKEHLKMPNGLVHYVKYLCLFHMDFIILDSEKNVKKTYTKLLEKNIPLRDFIYLRYADTKGNVKNKNTFYVMWTMYRRFLEIINKKVPFSIKDLNISGIEIMEALNIKPSRLIGDILRDVFEKVQEDLILNEKDVILEYIINNYRTL